MQEPTIVRRVARAVAEADYGKGVPISDDDIAAARAAIQAMREPTEAMLVEGSSEDGRQTAVAVWTLMIEAALSE